LAAEIETEALLRNVVTAIAPRAAQGEMLALLPLGAILLTCVHAPGTALP
jgi:hypothetical protein